MIETFTVDEFAAALPHNKNTGAPLCSPLGLVQGEFAWLMPIDTQVGIMIRSSISEAGVSRGTGEDSIRAWLVDLQSQAPMGAKVQRWVTRQRGWQVRLAEMLRTLWGWRHAAGNCSTCGEPLLLFRNHSTQEVFARCKERTHIAKRDERGRQFKTFTVTVL